MVVADIMTDNPVKVNMDAELSLIKEVFASPLVENESDKVLSALFQSQFIDCFKFLYSCSTGMPCAIKKL